MVYRCAVTLLFIHFVDCGLGDVVFGYNRIEQVNSLSNYVL